MKGKQGGHVKAPTVKAMSAGKPGGGSGPAGGQVHMGKTPSPIKGNPRKAGKGGK